MSDDQAGVRLPRRPLGSIPAPRSPEAVSEGDQSAPEVSGSPTALRGGRDAQSGSDPHTGPIDLVPGEPAPLFDPVRRHDVAAAERDAAAREAMRRPRLQRLIEIVLGMPAGSSTPIGAAHRMRELQTTYDEAIRARDLTIGQHRQFLRERDLAGDYWTWMTERNIRDTIEQRRRSGELTMTDLAFLPVPVVSESDGDE